MTFGLHPSNSLQELYMNKYWQGQDPHQASVLFLSIDANWSYDVEDKNPTVFKYIREYLEDGVEFWKSKGIHHPFLLPEYGRGDGWRFHRNFAKLGLDSSFASHVSFIELLDVPTYGMSTAKENQKTFNSLIRHDHLHKIRELIFEGAPKLVFIPKTTYRFLRKWNKNAEWFPFGLEPEALNGEGFINLHNENDHYIFVCNHFSASNTNEFYDQMGLIIKSFVENAETKQWWKVAYIGAWNGERVEECRFIWAKDVAEVKQKLLMHLNPHRVERELSQLEFSLVPETEVVESLIW